MVAREFQVWHKVNPAWDQHQDHIYLGFDCLKDDKKPRNRNPLGLVRDQVWVKEDLEDLSNEILLAGVKNEEFDNSIYYIPSCTSGCELSCMGTSPSCLMSRLCTSEI